MAGRIKHKKLHFTLNNYKLIIYKKESEIF